MNSKFLIKTKVDMKLFYQKILCILMACTFPILGCAKYKPANTSNQISENKILENDVFISGNDIDIHFAAIKDKQTSKEYLGIDPYKSNMLPVLLKITNNRNEVIKVDLVNSYVITKTAELHNNLSIDEAIKKALRSDAEVVGWMIGFGCLGFLVAGDNAASINRSLEEDYHDKYFMPTLLNIGSTAKGIVFFDYPREAQGQIISSVIQLTSLNTNEKIQIKIQLHD